MRLLFRVALLEAIAWYLRPHWWDKLRPSRHDL